MTSSIFYVDRIWTGMLHTCTMLQDHAWKNHLREENQVDMCQMLCILESETRRRYSGNTEHWSMIEPQFIYYCKTGNIGVPLNLAKLAFEMNLLKLMDRKKIFGYSPAKVKVLQCRHVALIARSRQFS